MADKTKGLWGSLKDFVVEDVPDAHQPSPSTPAAPNPAPAVVAPPVPRPSVPVQPDVDNAARLRLEESIAKAAPAGYTEVVDTVSTLADSIPDEVSRYRAALKLAAKRGHTVDAILGDVDTCIGILEEQGRQFETATRDQIERKVGARQKALVDIDAVLKSRQDQIASLQQEMITLASQRETEATAIAADTAKINTVRASFVAAYEAVHAQLQDRRQKIATYGKVTPS